VVHHTDNTRVEAFSDAIFGFAATLLVVSLEVPRDFSALTNSLRGFIAFGLSFGMLATIWSVHRGFFRRYPLGDSTTIVLNTILMFFVLFYVYPLKFLSRTFVSGFLGAKFVDDYVPITVDNLRQMFTIYGLGWAALFGCVALMYYHAWRLRMTPRVEAETGRTAADLAGHYLVFGGVGLVSAAMAIAGVGIRIGMPGFVYIIIGPSLGLYWSWRSRATQRHPS
jgi:uncharacterized membrane protein